MAFVSITRLRVRSAEFLAPFTDALPDIYAQASAADGLLASDLLADAHDTYWTKTVWSDRSAMRSYMTSGAHGAVMGDLRDWCDEAHVAHWEQDRDELPTWEEAHRRIVEEGRTSAVTHPSADHAARTVASPILS
jgi:Domain of unknown function (DUF3291)